MVSPTIADDGWGLEVVSCINGLVSSSVQVCGVCVTELLQGGHSDEDLCPLDRQPIQQACINHSLASMIQESNCTHHPGQPLRYFCPQDDTIMCSECAVVLHHGHERPLSMEEGHVRMRDKARGLLDRAAQRGSELEEAGREVGRVLEEVAGAGPAVEEAIRARATQVGK